MEEASERRKKEGKGRKGEEEARKTAFRLLNFTHFKHCLFLC